MQAAAQEVYVGVMIQVPDVQHHALYLAANQLVNLPLGGTGLGLVQLVVGLNGNRRSKTDEHALAHARVLRIMVGGGQDEDFFLEVSFFGRLEGHAGISVGEGAQPVLILVTGFRENKDGIALEQPFF